jgi:hypothetical protein
MESELLLIVTSYRADNYFTGGRISPKRLQSAIKNFGVDPRDSVLAIIDTSTFGFTLNGSASIGMAITPRGIFWKNVWMRSTRKSHYTWEEMASVAEALKVSAGDISFEPGVQYYCGGDLKAAQTINLLRAIVAFFVEWRGRTATPVAPAPANCAAPSDQLVLPDPRISAAEYEIALANGLALAVCVSGAVDEACLKTAIEFIRADDIIVDSVPAMDRFSDVVEQITGDAARSTAFLKLRQGKLLAACRPLNHPHLVERIAIMLDGVVEVTPLEGRHDLTEIKRRLMECIGR